MPVHHAGFGDEITRSTPGGGVEKVRLPSINIPHLIDVTVNAKGGIAGFHVLPSSVPAIASMSPITLSSGSVRIVDAMGVPIPGASVTITPRRVPANGFDAFEARVEVVDAAGSVIGINNAKSFFPQSWTQAKVQQAIYAAYVQHFQGGGVPVFSRMSLSTPEGVVIEMRVNGNQSASSINLKVIPTAYLQPGQHLTSGNEPQ